MSKLNGKFYSTVCMYNLHCSFERELPLTPRMTAEALPHVIIWDTRIFVLVSRSAAAYQEVLPHLIPTLK